eukprot:gene37867-46000_t
MNFNAHRCNDSIKQDHNRLVLVRFGRAVHSCLPLSHRRMLSRISSVSTRAYRGASFQANCRAMGTAKIIYTETDEAPALATYSLLPVVKKFASKAGVEVEKCDISLAARIISQFPKYLSEEQRIPDTLAQLGEL